MSCISEAIHEAAHSHLDYATIAEVLDAKVGDCRQQGKTLPALRPLWREVISGMFEQRDRSCKWQRYEVKYLISELQAAEVAHYCRDHIPYDPYSTDAEDHSYPIISNYLDSPSRVLLQRTVSKHPNRYKLRVRTYRHHYEPMNGGPAFFEVKRKANGIVSKTRAKLGSQQANSMLAGFESQCSVCGSHNHQADFHTDCNLDEFLKLRDEIGAEPVVGVSYLREAYEGISAERIRITLDRDIHYGVLSSDRNELQEMWAPAGVQGIVLEIKFTNTYPFWVGNMLRRLNIMRRGVCKYVICTLAAGVANTRAIH